MFQETRGIRKKIPVACAGISGRSAAYDRSEDLDITIYEVEPRLGGHGRTVTADQNSDRSADTGFILVDYATYPNLTKLLDELNVPAAKSEMSSGATIDNGRVEYGFNDLRTSIAQNRSLAWPSYYEMIGDILHFRKESPKAANNDVTTIGELVDQLCLGHWLRHNHNQRLQHIEGNLENINGITSTYFLKQQRHC